jgi:hypothetical protein
VQKIQHISHVSTTYMKKLRDTWTGSNRVPPGAAETPLPASVRTAIALSADISARAGASRQRSWRRRLGQPR